MKRIRVNAYQVALIFRKGEYKRFLLTGTYWFWKTEEIYVFDIREPFVPPVNLDLLLHDPALSNLLYRVEVYENQLVMQYVNSELIRILTPGTYIFWNCTVKPVFVRMDINQRQFAE